MIISQGSKVKTPHVSTFEIFFWLNAFIVVVVEGGAYLFYTQFCSLDIKPIISDHESDSCKWNVITGIIWVQNLRFQWEMNLEEGQGKEKEKGRH